MKFVRVEMPDGTMWDIPAKVIALHRTQYYMKKEGFAEGSAEYIEEFMSSMDNYELLDWASNNMDWVMVRESAVLASSPKPTPEKYDRAWVNARKCVISGP